MCFVIFKIQDKEKSSTDRILSCYKTTLSNHCAVKSFEFWNIVDIFFQPRHREQQHLNSARSSKTQHSRHLIEQPNRENLKWCQVPLISLSHTSSSACHLCDEANIFLSSKLQQNFNLDIYHHTKNRVYRSQRKYLSILFPFL